MRVAVLTYGLDPYFEVVRRCACIICAIEPLVQTQVESYCVHPVNDFRPSEPILIVSTHLDDAVLSCGHFLSENPQAVVLTVLAGAPEKLREGYNANTTGEIYAPDAIQKRRNEDAAAMDFLSVRPPVWLGHYDNDFMHWIRRRNDHKQIVCAIELAIREIGPGSVVTPLGLKHSDHVAIANACIELAKNSDLEWYLYMDMPYAQRRPKELRKREAFVRTILNLDDLEPVQIDTHQKREAFKLYESQYVPIGGGKPEFDQEMMTAEKYWLVIR
jgi:LmbE family N-acetylglucosaminyl deacetylase